MERQVLDFKYWKANRINIKNLYDFKKNTVFGRVRLLFYKLLTKDKI